MQIPENHEVVGRFFDAVNAMKESGKIRGKKTICDELGVDRRNYYHLEQDHSRAIFQVSWLSHLVIKYHISADWLLTGRGEMLKKK